MSANKIVSRIAPMCVAMAVGICSGGAEGFQFRRNKDEKVGIFFSDVKKTTPNQWIAATERKMQEKKELDRFVKLQKIKETRLIDDNIIAELIWDKWTRTEKKNLTDVEKRLLLEPIDCTSLEMERDDEWKVSDKGTTETDEFFGYYGHMIHTRTLGTGDKIGEIQFICGDQKISRIYKLRVNENPWKRLSDQWKKGAFPKISVDRVTVQGNDLEFNHIYAYNIIVEGKNHTFNSEIKAMDELVIDGKSHIFSGGVFAGNKITINKTSRHLEFVSEVKTAKLEIDGKSHKFSGGVFAKNKITISKTSSNMREFRFTGAGEFAIGGKHYKYSGGKIEIYGWVSLNEKNGYELDWHCTVTQKSEPLPSKTRLSKTLRRQNAMLLPFGNPAVDNLNGKNNSNGKKLKITFNVSDGFFEKLNSIKTIKTNINKKYYIKLSKKQKGAKAEMTLITNEGQASYPLVRGEQVITIESV